MKETVTVEGYGEDRDAGLAAARKKAEQYFGHEHFTLVEIEAEPYDTELNGRVRYWHLKAVFASGSEEKEVEWDDAGQLTGGTSQG